MTFLHSTSYKKNPFFQKKSTRKYHVLTFFIIFVHKSGRYYDRKAIRTHINTNTRLYA